MSSFHFVFESVDGGVELRLQSEHKPLFRRKKAELVARTDWPSATQLHAVSALARLESWVESSDDVARRLPDDDGYFISDAGVSALTESQAIALGLPADISYELRLDLTGSLVNPEATINLGWYSRAGRAVRGEEIGALFDDGHAVVRIPGTLFKVTRTIDAFNDWDGKDLDERLTLISSVRLALESVIGLSVDLDQQLKDLRLAHASSASIDIRVDESSVDFDPVLFTQETVQVAGENGEMVAEANQLLSPELQKVFRRQFRAKESVKPTYVVAQNQYVFVDPALRETLACIKTAQNTSPEERARFAKSPHSFIKQHLLDAGYDDEAADLAVSQSFAETDGLSDRVVEIGLWCPPVLPFVQREPNTWLPESFGIKVGSRSYSLPEGAVKSLANAVAEAIKEKRPEVPIPQSAETLPANEKTLDALNVLLEQVLKLPPVVIEQETVGFTDKVIPDEEEDSEPSEKMVLRVQNNFESEHFVAQFSPRLERQKYEKPRGLLNLPKTHQIEGMTWLQESWCAGYPGVLLADDMGLGKTFQTLGFLSWLFEKRSQIGLSQRPALILAPTSLLGNWAAEAKLHLSEDTLGPAELLYGAHLRLLKEDGLAGNDVTLGKKTLRLDKLASARWVLTTYETMRDHHISLASISFSCIVFDEMQKIKSPKSMMTNAAQALNGDFKVGLTGTPIENSLADIWTLFDTLIPGALGLGDLRHFTQHYHQNNPEALRKLKERLSNNDGENPSPMLRRMKSEVARDLPKKTEKVLDTVMPQVQAAAYNDAIGRGKAGFRREAFQQIRGISLHPFLPDSESAENAEEYIWQSARLSATLKILDAVHTVGEKALVFIESRAMHEWLAFCIKERYGLAFTPARIFGSVTAVRRAQIVEDFQSNENVGFDVLLLSPKAAGVGLTLTNATHVIHLSRWWNPAVEDQCTDRAYRIGQLRDVTVYFPRAIHPLYGEGSFDCILHDLLENKRKLSREMLIPMESKKDMDAFIDSTLDNVSCNQESDLS